MKSLLCISVLACFESFAAYTYVTNVIDDVVLTYRIDGTEAVVLLAELIDPPSSDVLKTVVIPKTVEGTNIRAVAGDAFNASHWLQAVTIPDSVAQVGMNAFANCSNLVSVNPTFHVREQNPSVCWVFARRSSLHSRYFGISGWLKRNQTSFLGNVHRCVGKICCDVDALELRARVRLITKFPANPLRI